MPEYTYLCSHCEVDHITRPQPLPDEVFPICQPCRKHIASLRYENKRVQHHPDLDFPMYWGYFARVYCVGNTKPAHKFAMEFTYV